MTMDIQKIPRSEQATPDLKMSVSGEESKSIEQFQTRTDQQFTSQNKSVKRSFDVAFLMMPDDKMKQRQLRVSKQLFSESAHFQRDEAEIFRKNQDYLNRTVSPHDQDDNKGTDLTTNSCYSEKHRYNNNVSPQSNQDYNIDVGTDEFAMKSVLSDSDISEISKSRPNSTESFTRHNRHINEYRNKVFDDPNISSHSRTTYDSHSDKFLSSRLSDANTRSAFTKVSNSFQSNQTPQPLPSPGHSESPDNLSYQNSMSPPLSAGSPPMINNLFAKNQQLKSLLPPNHPLLVSHNPFFKGHNIQGMHPQYSEYPSPGGNETTHCDKSPNNYVSQSEKNVERQEKHVGFNNHKNFGNLLPFNRPDLPHYLQSNSSYPFPMQNFHNSNEFLKFPSQNETINPLMRSPAAAILSTLLPPTLATLSLPAQNICAKCNISFRMTSDLVYHMRSHHKSETNYDAARRKREEKLKCPVCAESFRERHHLTRHMTAHQDKEGDILDHQLDASSELSSYAKSKNRYYVHSGMHTK